MFGFCLMMMMRWQLAYPGEPMPLIGRWLGEARMPGGVMLPDFYNELGAMHGTIMVFLGVVPLGVGGFGNYVLPLQIGAKDMAFPRLNMMSYQFFLRRRPDDAGDLLLAGRRRAVGLDVVRAALRHQPRPDRLDRRHGLHHHLVAARRDQLHRHDDPAARPGHELLALPVLRVGAVRDLVPAAARVPAARGRAPFMQLMDRVTRLELLPAEPAWWSAASRCRSPAAAIRSSGSTSSGSSPTPRSTCSILPAMGIVAEVITNNTRKPLWGYTRDGLLDLFLGFMSFIVWAHHMFMTGMGSAIGDLLPDHDDDHLGPLGGDPVGAVPVALGRLDPLQHADALRARPSCRCSASAASRDCRSASRPSDIHLHDTYYVIGHFHYVVAPGTIFGLLRRHLLLVPEGHRPQDERDARQGALLADVRSCMNGVFMPMFWLGLAGVSRRLYDGGASYALRASTCSG